MHTAFKPEVIEVTCRVHSGQEPQESWGVDVYLLMNAWKWPVTYMTIIHLSTGLLGQLSS